jgi:hypothetical protein
MEPNSIGGNVLRVYFYYRGKNARGGRETYCGRSGEDHPVVDRSLDFTSSLLCVQNNTLACGRARCDFEPSRQQRLRRRYSYLPANHGGVRKLFSHDAFQCSKHRTLRGRFRFVAPGPALSRRARKWITGPHRSQTTLHLGQRCSPDTWGAQ